MTDAPDVRPQRGAGEWDDRPPRLDGRAAAEARPVDETAVFRLPATSGGAGAVGASRPGAAVPGGGATLPPSAGSPSSGSLPSAAVASPLAGAAAPHAGGRRRAKLSLASIDPWSVFRFTLVFSVTLLIVWIVVAAVLWSLLNGMHVFDSLTKLINDVIPSQKDRTVDELFNFKRIMVWAAGLGVLNAILFTALGTLGSFIYNLCARIVGGFEVTLADRG
jgi:hypothetical protein